MLTKYASIEKILEVKEASARNEALTPSEPGENLAKFAKMADVGELNDGYLYVRARAISSRVNKNNDGWPSEELARSYKSFIGRPIFVDHNNEEPRRTRGVIVDAKLHVDDDEDKTASLDPYYAKAPDNHKPPTWVEILMEVDAKTFPKLADAIRKGDIDATSMGANIDRSVCSVCSNEATVPSDYCEHISSGKGATFEIVADNGEKVQKTAYEDCYGVVFFEDSFVFDPADPTADAWLHDGEDNSKLAATKEAGPILENLTQAWIAWLALRGGIATGQDIGKKVAPWLATKWMELHGEKPPTQEEMDEFYQEQYGRRGAVEDHKACPNCGDRLEGDYRDGGTLECANCGWTGGSDDSKKAMVKEAPGKKHVDAWSPKRNRQYEHIYDQCIADGGSKEECKEMAARTVNKQRAEKGETKKGSEDFKYAHLIKVADDGDRALNHEPQVDKTKAPEKVDTLRDDVQCPNCEADELQTDPDGLLRCPTCGYEQPPEGLDNPDLSRAKDFDQQQREEEQRDEEGNRQTPIRAGDEDVDPTSPGRGKNFIEPIQPVGATKEVSTNKEINDMNWKQTFTSDDPAKARAFLASKRKVGATAQGVSGHELGVHNGTVAVLADLGVTDVSIEIPDPGLEVLTRQAQNSPVPAPPLQLFEQKLGRPANVVMANSGIFFPHAKFVMDAYAREYGPGQVPLVVNSDQIDPNIVLQIIADGSSVQNMEQYRQMAQGGGVVAATTKNGPVNKQVVNPGSDRKGDEPKDEKIVADQLAPVTSDRRVIKREETPDGKRTEQIVEETGDLTGFDNDKGKEDEPKAESKEEDGKEDESKDSESNEPKGESKSDSRPDFLKKNDQKTPVAASTEKKLLVAFNAAEEAVELGIVPRDHKMHFVSELEKESVEEIEARRKTMAMVKSAGLSKRGPREVTARRLPKLASKNETIKTENGDVTLDDAPFEAIFWN